MINIDELNNEARNKDIEPEKKLWFFFVSTNINFVEKTLS